MACVATEPAITRDLLRQWIERDRTEDNAPVVLEARAADIAKFALAATDWQDAGRSAWYGWAHLRDATTPSEFANAMHELTDAMSDLVTWLPGYNADTHDLDEDPHFDCPRCRMRSYNPDDIEHGYCGNCHAYTGRETQVRIAE